MRVPTLTWSVVLGALLVAAPAAAQESPVVAGAELDAALVANAAAVDAQRETVRRVLDRPEVASVADRMGVDLNAAKAATSALAGAQLDRAAALSADVERALAGGQTFSINAMTLILILLLVIIVILIAS